VRLNDDESGLLRRTTYDGQEYFVHYYHYFWFGAMANRMRSEAERIGQPLRAEFWIHTQLSYSRNHSKCAVCYLDPDVARDMHQRKISLSAIAGRRRCTKDVWHYSSGRLWHLRQTS
jgi:hypothetical protein